MRNNLTKSEEYPEFPPAERHWDAFEAVLRALLTGPKSHWRPANRLLRRIIDLQVTQPEDPIYGNWAAYDTPGRDLGPGLFYGCMIAFLLKEVPERLDKSSARACRRSIEGMISFCVATDQHVGYTNYTSMAFAILLLGGEIVGNSAAIAFGHRKLEAWENLLHVQGGPDEYATPSYTLHGVWPVHLIARHSRSPALRLRARLAVERLWLHALMHLHQPSAAMGGPHSRAYTVLDASPGTRYIPAIMRGDPPAHHYRPLHFPAYLLDYFRQRTYPFHAREVVRLLSSGVSPLSRNPHNFRAFRLDWHRAQAQFQEWQTTALDDVLVAGEWATVFQSHHFSLGSINCKTQRYRQVQAWQRDNAIATLAGEGTAALFCRHLLAPAGAWPRSSQREGSFMASVQSGPALLLRHAPMFRDGLRPSCSRSVWVMPRDVDELLVDGEPVKRLPCKVNSGAVVAARRDDVCWAIRCLAVFGSKTAVRLTAEKSTHLLGSEDTPRRMLVLSAESYRGPRRSFSEDDIADMSSWSALEMAEVADIESLATWSARLEKATWSLKNGIGRYRRGKLRLRLDPAAAPEDGDALIAGDAVQNRRGRLHLDDIEVQANPVPLLLLRRSPGCYELLNPLANGIRLRLRAPGVDLAWDAFPRCRMEIDLTKSPMRCRFDCLGSAPAPASTKKNSPIVSRIRV